jgi:hypothetical protein
MTGVDYHVEESDPGTGVYSVVHDDVVLAVIGKVHVDSHTDMYVMYVMKWVTEGTSGGGQFEPLGEAVGCVIGAHIDLELKGAV